jgi:hypothetical protein
MWGGSVSALLPPTAPNADLWRFDVDDNGSGSWTQIPTPENLVRSAHALYAVANGVGYSVGGDTSIRTSAYFYGISGGWLAIPGIVSYDMASGDFNIASTSGLSGTGLATSGQLIHIPAFGHDGILVALGGTSSPNTTSANGGDGPALIDFSSIAVYDIYSAQWLSQATTGQVPTARLKFCAVGVEGKDSYEIFIHGGHVPGDGSAEPNFFALDEIYVLSLPSFQWFKADYPATMARFEHCCNVVGQRQMLVVGGAPSIDSWIDSYGNIRDQWTWGLGVFDMSEMKWSPRYDASAQAYVTSDVVLAGIRMNGAHPSEWSSTAVQQLFSNTTFPSAPSTPSAVSNSRSSSHLSTGAIVGAVVGSAGFVILICGAFWCVRQGKRRARDRLAEPPAQRPPYEMPEQRMIRHGSEMYPAELDQSGERFYNSRVTEMMRSDQGFPPSEMPA